MDVKKSEWAGFLREFGNFEVEISSNWPDLLKSVFKNLPFFPFFPVFSLFFPFFPKNDHDLTLFDQK